MRKNEILLLCNLLRLLCKQRRSAIESCAFNWKIILKDISIIIDPAEKYFYSIVSYFLNICAQ